MNNTERIKKISSVLSGSGLTTNKKKEFKTAVSRINSRISDPNIYVGIVGEFSSGKSTLINSLIGADFFVTNALQGTTTVVTKISYAPSISMTVVLTDGSTLSYSNNKRDLLKTFTPDKWDSLSLFKKLSISSNDLFGSNKYDDLFHDVFDAATTSDNKYMSLKEVRVTFPSDKLKGGIVIVDTPGTDSLNPEHTKITQSAIKDICDLSAVLIPATKPLSSTLSDFIEDNLREDLDKCIFLITKIELIQREVERRQLKKGIQQRIKATHDIDEPNIIVAPTLLSLEERHIITPFEQLKHLSQEERMALCTEYDHEIEAMLESIRANREKTINDKINSLVERLRSEITDSLSHLELELSSELDATRNMRVKPLADFMQEYTERHPIITLESVKQSLKGKFLVEQTQFTNYIKTRINNCTTKDDVQSIMGDMSVRSRGSSAFDNCYTAMGEMLTFIINEYQNNFTLFQSTFSEYFQIDALDFEYKVKNDPKWRKSYLFYHDTSDLTTFPPFRFFMSLSAVKNQMIDDVVPQISCHFAEMERHYIELTEKAYSDISKQMKVIYSKFMCTFDSKIKNRIKEGLKKENSLNSQITKLQDEIKILSEI